MSVQRPSSQFMARLRMVPFIGSMRCNTRCHCQAQSIATYVWEVIAALEEGDTCRMYLSHLYNSNMEKNIWTISTAYAYRKPTIPSSDYLSREDMGVDQNSFFKELPFLAKKYFSQTFAKFCPVTCCTATSNWLYLGGMATNH